jgi:hypothetical protein
MGQTTVTVLGTADPYLAGMPAGSTAIYGDSAPAESPTAVPGTLPAAGSLITFGDITGSVSYNGGTPVDPPDGYPGFWLQHADQPAGSPQNPENGIADLIAPCDSLVGVFLGSGQPNLSTAPVGLDFSGLGAAYFTEVGTLNFLSLSPKIAQPFFIGNGLTNSDIEQTFVVPAGATRLFLGSMDTFSWYNNTGSFSVQVNGVPEPTSTCIFGLGAVGLLAMRWRPPASIDEPDQLKRTE